MAGSVSVWWWTIFLVSTEGEESFADSLRSEMWTQLIGGTVIFVIGLVALMLVFARPDLS